MSGRIAFHVITLFPEIFSSPFNASIIKKAQEKGLISISLYDLRDYATGKHRTVDDYPYGGGSGMVMKPAPLGEAITTIKNELGGARVVLTTPQGELFTHNKAQELSKEERIILICGRYEGYDDRVRYFVDDEISIGDYVLTGGELPAMVIIDSVGRLVPGVVGAEASIENDSFFANRLDHPHYTRPSCWQGLAVPEVLLSGDHKKIIAWRKKEALRRTLERRADLIEKHTLTEEEKLFLKDL